MQGLGDSGDDGSHSRSSESALREVQQEGSPGLDGPPVQHTGGQQDPLLGTPRASPPCTAPVVQGTVPAGAAARANSVAAAAGAASQGAGVDGASTGARGPGTQAPGAPGASADAASTGSIRTSTSGTTDAATSSVTNSNSSTNTDSTSSISCSFGAEEAGMRPRPGRRHTAQATATAAAETQRAGGHVPNAQHAAAAIVPPLPPVTTGLPEQLPQQQTPGCFVATATGSTDVGESEGRRDRDEGCTAAVRADCCCAPGAEGCGVKVPLQTSAPAPSTPRTPGRSSFLDYMRMWKVAGEALDASAASPRAGTCWPHSCPPDQPHTPRASLPLLGSGGGHSSITASCGLGACCRGGTTLWAGGSGSGSGIVLSAPPSLQLTHACSNIVTTGHGTERALSPVSSAPEPGSAPKAANAVDISATPTIGGRTGTTPTWSLCPSVFPPGGPLHCTTAPPLHAFPNHTFPVSLPLWLPPSTPAHCPPATATAAVQIPQRDRGPPTQQPATSPAPACSFTAQLGPGTVSVMGVTAVQGLTKATVCGRPVLQHGPEQPGLDGTQGSPLDWTGRLHVVAGACEGVVPAGGGAGSAEGCAAAVVHDAGPLPRGGKGRQLLGGGQLPRCSEAHEQTEDRRGQQEEQEERGAWAAAGVVAEEACGKQQQQQREQVGQEVEGGRDSNDGRLHKRQRSVSTERPGRSSGLVPAGADTAAGQQAGGACGEGGPWSRAPGEHVDTHQLQQHEPEEGEQGRVEPGPGSMEGLKYGGWRSSSAQRGQGAAVPAAGESSRPRAPSWFPQVVVTSGATLPMVGDGSASLHCTPSPRCMASHCPRNKASAREGGSGLGFVGSAGACGRGASWGSTNSGRGNVRGGADGKGGSGAAEAASQGQSGHGASGGVCGRSVAVEQAAMNGDDGGEVMATGKRAKRTSSERSHTSVCVGQVQGQVQQQALRRLQVEQQQQQQQQPPCEPDCQGGPMHPGGAQEGCMGVLWQEERQQRHSAELGSAGLSGGSQADCALPVGHMGGVMRAATAPYLTPSMPSLAAPFHPPYALSSCGCPSCRAAAAAAAAAATTAAATPAPYSFAHGALHPGHTLPSFTAPPPTAWPGPCPCAACAHLRAPLAGTPLPFHPPPPPSHPAISASSYPCPALTTAAPASTVPPPATPRSYPGCPCPVCLQLAAAATVPAAATAAARLQMLLPTTGSAPVHSTPCWPPYVHRASSVGSAPSLPHTPPYPYAYSPHMPPPVSPYTPHPWVAQTAVRPGCPCAACLATRTHGQTTAGAAAEATAAAATAEVAIRAAPAAAQCPHPPPSATYSASRPFASWSSGFGPGAGAAQGTAHPQTCTHAHARLAPAGSLPAVPHLHTRRSHPSHVPLAPQPHTLLSQPSKQEPPAKQQQRLEHGVQQSSGTVQHGGLPNHHIQGSPQAQGSARGCAPCPEVSPSGAAACTPTPFVRWPGTAATPVQLPPHYPPPHSHYASPYNLPGATYAFAHGVPLGPAPGQSPAPVQVPEATATPGAGAASDAVACTPDNLPPHQYQPGLPRSGAMGGWCGEAQLDTPRAVAAPPASLARSSLGVGPTARSRGSSATGDAGGQKPQEGGEGGAAVAAAAAVAVPQPGAILGTRLSALQPRAAHACVPGPAPSHTYGSLPGAPPHTVPSLQPTFSLPPAFSLPPSFSLPPAFSLPYAPSLPPPTAALAHQPPPLPPLLSTPSYGGSSLLSPTFSASWIMALGSPPPLPPSHSLQRAPSAALQPATCCMPSTRGYDPTRRPSTSGGGGLRQAPKPPALAAVTAPTTGPPLGPHAAAAAVAAANVYGKNQAHVPGPAAVPQALEDEEAAMWAEDPLGGRGPPRGGSRRAATGACG